MAAPEIQDPRTWFGERRRGRTAIETVKEAIVVEPAELREAAGLFIAELSLC